MTHVLDEAIEAAEDAIRESFIFRHDYDWPEPGTPKSQKQQARDSLRSMVAALRILRAEREGRRLAGARDADGRPISSKLERHHMEALMGKTLDEIRSEERVEREDELRAEGRREERERLIPWMRERLRGMIVETCEDLEPALQEAERGDHWRGGEG